MNISNSDRQKYLSIFQAQSPVNGKLSGEKAKTIFLQSNLSMYQLEQIWNLCDYDQDGSMGSEEFVLAMHFIFSLINKSISGLPTTLPPHMIPNTRINNGNGGFGILGGVGNRNPTVPPPNMHSAVGGGGGFGKSFDWHIPSSDKASYTSIFNRFCPPNQTLVSIHALRSFLLEKGFSPEDLLTAWNLVDVGKRQSLNLDQFSLLLHLLNSKSKGINFPNSIPIHLSNRFLGKSTYTPPTSTHSNQFNTNYSNSNINNSNNSSSLMNNSYQSNSSFHSDFSNNLPNAQPTNTFNSSTNTSAMGATGWSKFPQPQQQPQPQQPPYQSLNSTTTNFQPTTTTSHSTNITPNSNSDLETQLQIEKLQKEINDLDLQLQNPPPPPLPSTSTQVQQYEELLKFLKQVDSYYQHVDLINKQGDQHFVTELETLVKEIKHKWDKLQGLVNLKHKELTEVELKVDREKYMV